jgi:3-isopropylmalate/(R)-2-methylmalate dehydratase small subunit
LGGFIYFRNAVNNGLLPVICPAAVEAIQTDETVEIDLDAHQVRCAADVFDFPPLSLSVMRIIEAGGFLAMLRQRKT